MSAFFRSTLPAQCAPVQNHILLVPTTEVLLNSKDADSNALYADLASSEEFLSSHVLRLSAEAATAKEGGTMRDNRAKARQYNTMNGRTVVLKDGLVYSNKGFKIFNQAQLLNDVVYYQDSAEPRPWLIYYISRPLIGAFESTLIATELSWTIPSVYRSTLPTRSRPKVNGDATSTTTQPRKKDISSFNDLLNQFPMIARQMQSGLETLFKELANGNQKPLPATPPETPRISDADARKTLPARPESLDQETEPDDPEERMRLDLETAITAAIDLFQLVDKQQLSLLGATTDLTGSIVERLIEKYVTEQVHEAIIFPKLRAVYKAEDAELEAMVRQMESIDISQVGIPIKGGQAGKREFLLRLDKGVEEFRKLGVAGSPQEMLEVLLNTEKTISHAVSYDSTPLLNGDGPAGEEKPSTMMTINADTLVSLLLVVVIRAQVRHLQARLTYMRRFIFIEDVESGEIGYALSTFEAVLTYLANDSSGLRRASRRNRRLWHATRTGDAALMKEILEPSVDFPEGETLNGGEDMEHDLSAMKSSQSEPAKSNGYLSQSNSRTSSTERSTAFDGNAEDSSLSHVFPFRNRKESVSGYLPEIVARKGKRVALDIRSMSSSSIYSFHSRTTTIDSRISESGIENDTSIERLTGTQDSAGHSLLMMAIENHQADALEYLLGLKLYFSAEVLLEDTDNDGMTLLSAAVQSADKALVDPMLEAILSIGNEHLISEYISRVDKRGRSVGHYIVDSPYLITKLGHLIDWRQRDRNGQTPLFSLCRAYDHPEYIQIVCAGLDAALTGQGDGQPLHLDDHVDAKGNTLLHIVNDAQLARRLLFDCDLDVNAMNDKHFTPLMVASKYGRIDMVRCFFDDARTDLHARELRGFTAVELAKDDEVRNRIDDLILLAQAATGASKDTSPDGRVTGVVRSFFVEDASVRLVLKSGIPSSPSSYTVTTCRRSLSDFESLAKWLAIEHPASWIPSLADFRSPFQIASRPSRSVLRSIQTRLDGFLHVLLSHPTFSTHEMLWEFFLVPDMHLDMMAARSAAKAATRTEKLKEQYNPIDDIETAELFTRHARESVHSVIVASRSAVRRVNKIRNISIDLAEAYHLLNLHTLPFTFLPQTHHIALTMLAHAFSPPSTSPHTSLHASLLTTLSTLKAVSKSLTRPSVLITNMHLLTQQITKHTSSARRADRWPLDLNLGLGLLDETRARLQAEAEKKAEDAREARDTLGREIEASRVVVAAELAGWQAGHAKEGRRVVRAFVVEMVVREREVLAGMRRAVRALGRRE
ncbi:MAG: hypothetical protein M1814_003117 [Vezdaea aestivalis]|nr:MAG: hypothetical protein M1814_003117 [Vezdaea aestivalis]